MFATMPMHRWSPKYLILAIFLLLPIVVSAQPDPPGNIIMRPILGVQKILFIRVIYPDDNMVVLSDERAPIHADNLNALIEANSYGTLSLEIDITPILTMPQPKSYYTLENRQSLVRIRADALMIAENAGYNIDDYDREAIFTIRLWPQQAFKGIGGVNIRTIYTSWDVVPHTAHELGHTFDWRHANFWRVTSNNPIDTAGVLIQYGDKFDIMGDVHNYHHYNPWFKFRVGWLSPESILTVSESGTYVIRGLELTPQSGDTVDQYTALRIRRDPDNEYWIYYRSQEDLANTGALISQISPRNTSYALLLDMTPGSKGENRDYEDAALVPGETIQDPEAGIEITVLEKYDDSLLVQVVISQNQIDTLPVMDIISPLPGITVEGAVDYEATAFDPDVGNVNGVGIDTVQFLLGYLEGDDPWGEGLTFITVAQEILTSPPYVFHVETDSLPDEAYRLYVGTISENGGTNTVSLSHLIDNTGPSIPSSVDEKHPDIASTFQLQQNYPNPFNPSTVIMYSVGKRELISLKVYDVLGREMVTLVNEVKEPGNYEVEFNATDLPSGIYLYKLNAGTFVQTKKMILIK